MNQITYTPYLMCYAHAYYTGTSRLYVDEIVFVGP